MRLNADAPIVSNIVLPPTYSMEAGLLLQLLVLDKDERRGDGFIQPIERTVDSMCIC